MILGVFSSATIIQHTPAIPKDYLVLTVRLEFLKYKPNDRVFHACSKTNWTEQSTDVISCLQTYKHHNTLWDESPIPTVAAKYNQ